jgi:hypothetical protein
MDTCAECLLPLAVLFSRWCVESYTTWSSHARDRFGYSMDIGAGATVLRSLLIAMLLL